LSTSPSFSVACVSGCAASMATPPTPPPGMTVGFGGGNAT
jgi:hypothetical protein